MSILAKPEIVVASYLASEWSRWQSETADGNSFFAGTHDEWLARMQTITGEKTRQGYHVFIVEITVDEFLAWADRNGRTKDAEARAEYAGLNVGQMRFS